MDKSYTFKSGVEVGFEITPHFGYFDIGAAISATRYSAILAVSIVFIRFSIFIERDVF